MYLLAPAVLCVGISFLLYGATDIWEMGVYKMQAKNIHPVIAQDVVNLQKAIKTKQISPNQAEAAFQQKYQTPSQTVKTVMDQN